MNINTGNEKIFVLINELLKERCGIAIQDDKKFYKDNEKKSDAGRPLIIDKNDYFT